MHICINLQQQAYGFGFAKLKELYVGDGGRNLKVMELIVEGRERWI